MNSPRASTTARSTTFFNSRTLPGQRYLASSSMAGGRKSADLAAGLGVEFLQEIDRPAPGMSSGRLRSGGTRISSTAQSKVEIAAKASVDHVPLQIAIRGGDHPHVDLDGLGAADALERMPFQHAQELGLNGRAHLADFVEHQRALVRGLELADLALGGTGEGPLLVAEQLAGQQAPRQGGAVQADERPLAARTGKMDRPRDQLLADAALAANQDGGPAGGGAGDFLGHAGHGQAGADNFALHAQPLAQLQVFVADAVQVFGQLLPPVEVVDAPRPPCRPRPA